MCFIHISAHGDEDGIELTNGEVFDWPDFEIELKKINKVIGFIKLPKEYSQKVSKVSLSFSSCKGYQAHKIHNRNRICQFQGVVGPVKDISWADSLTAFVTFYHLLNQKCKSVEESVRKMNTASGLRNIFDFYASPELSKKNSYHKLRAI